MSQSAIVSGQRQGSKRVRPSPFTRPARLAYLIPGLPQWTWGQRDRGLALSLLYCSSMLVATFAWGTPVGWLCCAVGCATHVASAYDALRQSAFPTRPGWEAWLVSAFGLGLCLYVPLMAFAVTCAWPDADLSTVDDAHPGYWVNLWAYRAQMPRTGEWVWLRSTKPLEAETRAGRVIAGPGQHVRWRETAFQVNGSRVPLNARPKSLIPPRELELTVPAGYLLIDPDTEDSLSMLGGIELVPLDRVGGRPWARAYPIHQRQRLNSTS